jgi:hypothetical protein
VSELNPPDLAWRKSSHSEDANCLELAVTPACVLVRHSHDRSGGILRFTYAEWHTFLAKVRNNGFDTDMLTASPED